MPRSDGGKPNSFWVPWAMNSNAAMIRKTESMRGAQIVVIASALVILLSSVTARSVLLEIYIDADACPVKDEIYRVAERYGLKSLGRGQRLDAGARFAR